MNKIEAIIRPEMSTAVKDALAEAGFVGLNEVPVTGRGAQKGVVHQGRSGQPITIDMLPKVKLELVVPEGDTNKVCDIIIGTARTGKIGDGKIFVSPVVNAIRVRTGEQGDDIL